MPRVRKTLQCPSCGKTLAAKTVRRHMRDWMGLCTREQRQAARWGAALRHLLDRLPRRGGRTRSVVCRNRQGAGRPSSLSPSPLRKSAHRPPQGEPSGSQNPHVQPPSPSNVPLSQSPPPGRTDFELYMRGRAWHNDFALDTPGAGPSQEMDPYAELQQYAAETDQQRAEPLPTLADHAEWIRGLSAQETLEQEIEVELDRSGGKYPTVGVDYFVNLFSGRQLDPADLATVRAFNYKVDTDISTTAFEKLPRAFPELSTVQSLYRTRTRIARLSGVKGVDIDCCINSCVAFTGTIKDMEKCPYCYEARYEMDANNPNQRHARSRFRYIPIIPRLRNLFQDPNMVHELVTP